MIYWVANTFFYLPRVCIRKNVGSVQGIVEESMKNVNFPIV